jgi:hypothetical protein
VEVKQSAPVLRVHQAKVMLAVTAAGALMELAAGAAAQAQSEALPQLLLRVMVVLAAHQAFLVKA